MKLALPLLAIAACSSQDDRGTAVKPRPTPRDVAPTTLTLDDWETAVFGAGPKATFQQTTAKEIAAIKQLVPAMLEGSWSATPPNPSTWHDDALEAGFRIESWSVDGERYWALLEASGSARGAGAYMFRVAPKSEGLTILLQAPHSYFDVNTGRIAGELFFAKRDGARPRALFTNTIHRYQLAPGDKKKRKTNPADVAHNPDHAFTVATDAFATAARGTRVIQLHGFKPRADDDGDVDLGNIAMVISAGDKTRSSATTTTIAAAAQKAFGDEVKRYPEDTKVLGATTNVQGRRLRASGHGDFVHVEMSAELRDRLTATEVARAQLATILFDAEVTR